MNQTVSATANKPIGVERDPSVFYWRGIPYTTDQDIPQSGMVLVDKPEGWSSHDVVNFFRRRTGVRRIGHAGTLDPLATGLLIILIGREFTKLQSQYLKQDKAYEVEMVLGITTDTYDITGAITHQATPEQLKTLTKEKLQHTLTEFIGTQSQKVPLYSAVKVSGQKLYAHAREQQLLKEQPTLEPPTKQVTIKNVTLQNWQSISFSANFRATLTVECSSGTYIRSLVHDIGQKLGVGATVTALRRVCIGEISIANSNLITIKLVQE
jgi:tRNA pseudouridine55 synthase